MAYKTALGSPMPAPEVNRGFWSALFRSPTPFASSRVHSREELDIPLEGGSPPSSPSRMRQATDFLAPTMQVAMEELRELKAHPLRALGKRMLVTSLIGPDVLWKRSWDWTLLLLVVYNAVKIPLDISFDTGQRLDSFDWAVDAIFVVDVWFSFRQSFVDPLGHTVRDNSIIARRYLSSWFLIDFAAAVPTDMLMLAATNDRKQLLLLKLPRLLRIGRLMKKMEQIQICSFILLAHWMACSFFSLSLAEQGDDRWTSFFGVADQRVWTQYSTSLYWALTTMTTVGYGDITPISTQERWFTMLVFVFGAISYSSIFANVSMLLQSVDENGHRYRTKLSTVGKLLRFCKVPLELEARIRGNMQYNWAVTGGFDFHEVLYYLPRTLRTELAMTLYEDTIRKAPMFKSMPKAMVQEIAVSLTAETALPGDWIFCAGDIGHDMVFLGHGRVEITSSDDSSIVLATLGKGAFFGETALFFWPARRSAGVRATTHCVLYIMHKKTLEGILEEFPDEKEAIVDVTTKQRARNQAANIALLAHKRALTKRIGTKWLRAARRRSSMSSMSSSAPDLSTLRENQEHEPDHSSEPHVGPKYSFLEVGQSPDHTDEALDMMMSMRPHNTAPLRDKEWRARRTSLARRGSMVNRRDSTVSQTSDENSPNESMDTLRAQDGAVASSSRGGPSGTMGSEEVAAATELIREEFMTYKLIMDETFRDLMIKMEMREKAAETRHRQLEAQIESMMVAMQRGNSNGNR